MAVTGTDAALASDIVAQVSAPSSPMPGAFGSRPLGSLWWGSPEELFGDTWPGGEQDGAFSWGAFLGWKKLHKHCLASGVTDTQPSFQ